MDTERLHSETILWLATTRPDGRPHLTPIWYCWVDERFWVCSNSNAVKVRNISQNAHASVALGTGAAPIVAECEARVHARPYPENVRAAFVATFDWDIGTPDDDGPYDALVELVPVKWLMGASG
ncbi:MAG: Pyridoxamine 5-phosphate oxidase [Acidimicrobiia bacterium]|nr:Pyridoxamine 5-phosphate oxidase [Acidimicrobiia bacterium]